LFYINPCEKEKDEKKLKVPSNFILANDSQTISLIVCRQLPFGALGFFRSFSLSSVSLTFSR
jgi:hypothetical protein